MFKTATEMTVTETEGLRGGSGLASVIDIVEPEALHGAGRLFAVSILAPGASVGYHQHSGDFEIYYILEGEAEVTVDGETRLLKPGDAALCPDGSWHGAVNKGDTDMRYIAAILYSQQ